MWIASAALNNGDYQRVLDLMEPLLAKNSEHASALVMAAAAHVCLGQYDQAIAYCDKALAVNPKDVMSYNNRAGALLSLDRADEAIIDATKALELDRKCTKARINRGIGYGMTNRYKECEADCRQALAEDPKSIRARFWLITAKVGMWKLDEALLDCNQALTLCSTQYPEMDSPIKLLRSVCYLCRHEFAKAIDGCNAILDSPNPLPAALLIRAEAQADNRKFQKALNDLDALDRTNPKNNIKAWSLCCRSQVALELQMPELALQYATDALDLRKDQVTLTHKAIVLLKNNETDNAIDLLSEAIEIDAFAAEAYWYLHRAYAARGENEKARENANTALCFGYKPLD